MENRMGIRKILDFRKSRKLPPEQGLSREQLLVSKFLSELRLRPRLWGVDEAGVWKALERLTVLYEDALTVERSRRELAQRKLEALQQRREDGNGS